MVGAEAYIRKHGNPSSETKSFAFYTTLNYLGWTLGMVIASFTVLYYGLNWMFLFVLPGVLGGLVILRKIRENGLSRMLTGFKKYFHNGQDFQALFRDVGNIDRRTFFFLLLSFFDGVIVMFTFIFIPLFAASIHLSLPKIALLMAVMYMPFVFSFIISEATDRWKRMDVIAFGLLIGALAFVFLSFILNEILIAIMATMKSVSLAILRPAYNGMITHLTPRRMLGEVTSLNNISMRLGFIVGPILTGVLADAYGLRMSFFAVAVSAFVLAVISLILRGLEPQKENA